jgi:23S rRNA pseudouridine955/2504/2580 synthase
MKLIRKGDIKINNNHVDVNYHLKLNDKIILPILNNAINEERKKADSKGFLKAKNILDVVFEDKNIIIVNKPIGLSSQPDEYCKTDSLIQRIKLYLYNKKEFQPTSENVFAPQLCNRIDRNTQGLVIAAKNIAALNIMNEKIKNKEVQKYYLCKIHGRMKKQTDTLKDFWTKDQITNSVKISKKPLNKDSLEIITKYNVVDEDKYHNQILEINLITGKKHQIRAHMCFYKHPLFGEKKYCLKEYKDECEFQQLYSYKIKFDFFSPSSELDNLKNEVVSLEYLNNKIVSLKKDSIIEALKKCN